MADALSGRAPLFRNAALYRWPRASLLCPLGATARKPDVRNLPITGACAFTVAGWTCAHATRPRKIRDRALSEGFRRPASRLSREATPHCSTWARRQVECQENVELAYLRRRSSMLSWVRGRLPPDLALARSWPLWHRHLSPEGRLCVRLPI